MNEMLEKIPTIVLIGVAGIIYFIFQTNVSTLSNDFMNYLSNIM